MTKATTNPLVALLIQVAFCAAVWLGFWQGVTGARYVAQFAIWCMLLPAYLAVVLALATGLVKDKPETKRRGPLSRVVSALIAWGALGTFVWTGHQATAAAWLACMVCAALIRIEPRATDADGGATKPQASP